MITQADFLLIEIASFTPERWADPELLLGVLRFMKVKTSDFGQRLATEVP